MIGGADRGDLTSGRCALTQALGRRGAGGWAGWPPTRRPARAASAQAPDLGEAADTFGEMVSALGGPHDFTDRWCDGCRRAGEMNRRDPARSRNRRPDRHPRAGEAVVRLGGGPLRQRATGSICPWGSATSRASRTGRSSRPLGAIPMPPSQEGRARVAETRARRPSAWSTPRPDRAAADPRKDRLMPGARSSWWLDSVGIGGTPRTRRLLQTATSRHRRQHLGHIAAACAAGKAEERTQAARCNLPNLDALGPWPPARLPRARGGAGLDACRRPLGRGRGGVEGQGYTSWPLGMAACRCRGLELLSKEPRPLASRRDRGRGHAAGRDRRQSSEPNTASGTETFARGLGRSTKKTGWPICYPPSTAMFKSPRPRKASALDRC